ncbi:MAG TPA: dTDP-4-dehydrorhamnose 3,5-epimerase [Kofleriaceae bacterium]
MRFTETSLAGAFVIDVDRLVDARGFFARTFCRREFADHGIDFELVQASVSFSPQRHTLRGLHYQEAPHQEAKLVRCVAGAIFDVIVDLRRSSPTYLQWFGLELSAEAMNALYVPPDMAHGFITLGDGATVQYQMSHDYQPQAARGLRWNDPRLAIRWPAEPAAISERDAGYPLLEERA